MITESNFRVFGLGIIGGAGFTLFKIYFSVNGTISNSWKVKYSPKIEFFNPPKSDELAYFD